MMSSKRGKAFYYIAFLLPALALYSLFFIKPFIEGIRYSFTDWNGIVPEIPLNMTRERFERDVAVKLQGDRSRLDFLRRYYVLDESGEFYRLRTWVQEDGRERQLSDRERRKIQRVLKTAGVTPIKYIGLKNYRDMFKNDIRFIPRVEQHYLFNEFDDLPGAIDARTFTRNLLAHISNPGDRSLVLSKYVYDPASAAYRLGTVGDDEAARLKSILAGNMFEDRLIPGVIGFTLFFTFFNVLFCNLLALLLALVLDTRMKTRNILRSIFFLPNVLSLIIVAFIWSFVFRLIMPALTGIPVWLGSPDLAPWAVVMVSVWQGCGYLMIIYLAGLQTIPAEVLEGAMVDGAGGFRRFWHVKLPLLLPAVTICLFYSLANSLKTFDVIYALTNGGGPGYATTSVVIDIYNNAFLQNQFGYATAKAILLCLIIIVITGTQLSLMKRREVEL